MSLRGQARRPVLAQQRDVTLRRLEVMLEEAFASATRAFLRRAQTAVTLEELTAASTRAVRMFSQDEAREWWADALLDTVEPMLGVAWRMGYFDTRDGLLSERAQNRMSTFLYQRRDELSASESAPPTLAYQAASKILRSGLETSETLARVAEAMALELAWDEGWETVAAALARRTATSSYNIGALAAADDEDDAEVKVWIATPDDITRDTHLDASGQCVLLSDLFAVGGDLLDYPGDEFGSPEEVMNCRCSLVFAASCAEADEMYGDVIDETEREADRRSSEDDGG